MGSPIYAPQIDSGVRPCPLPLLPLPGVLEFGSSRGIPWFPPHLNSKPPKLPIAKATPTPPRIQKISAYNSHFPEKCNPTGVSCINNVKSIVNELISASALEHQISKSINSRISVLPKSENLSPSLPTTSLQRRNRTVHSSAALNPSLSSDHPLLHLSLCRLYSQPLSCRSFFRPHH